MTELIGWGNRGFVIRGVNCGSVGSGQPRKNGTLQPLKQRESPSSCWWGWEESSTKAGPGRE